MSNFQARNDADDTSLRESGGFGASSKRTSDFASASIMHSKFVIASRYSYRRSAETLYLSVYPLH